MCCIVHVTRASPLLWMGACAMAWHPTCAPIMGHILVRGKKWFRPVRSILPSGTLLRARRLWPLSEDVLAFDRGLSREKNPEFTAVMPAVLEAARRRIQSTCVSKLTFYFSSRCYFLASCLCCRCVKRLPCLPGIAIPCSFLARPRCTAVPDR